MATEIKYLFRQTGKDKFHVKDVTREMWDAYLSRKSNPSKKLDATTQKRAIAVSRILASGYSDKSAGEANSILVKMGIATPSKPEKQNEKPAVNTATTP